MNETITRAGWVATDPELYIDATGAESATFRLAVPANRPDELTQWFTVKARHNLALNVAESLKKGQPVLVVGNMPHHTWSGLPQHRLTLTVTDLGPCWKDVSRAQALSR